MSNPPKTKELDAPLPTEEETQSVRIELQNKSKLVGSAPSCDIVIEHPSVSPVHLRIAKMDNGLYRIVDLDSEHGVFAAGYRKKSFFASAQDVIQIGQYPIEVQRIVDPQDRFSVQESDDCSTMEVAVELTIGSKEPADVILPYPVISQRHAAIRLDANGLLICDLGSEYGVKVNDELIEEWCPLGPDDKLTLGNYHVPARAVRRWVQQLRRKVSSQTVQTSVRTPIPVSGSLKIGRDPSSDIMVDHPTVSWNHAVLEFNSGVCEIVDLSSANGSFIDGQRVRRAKIDQSNELRLGSVYLRIFEEQIVNAERIRDDIRLDASYLSFQVKPDLTLLNDISLSIYPGEMVALMGPSGAGKTTLLEVLSGRRPASSGRVLLNGRDLFKGWEEHRHNIGFVPQEDIMHRDLTVFEVLYFAAKLRLPRDLPDDAIISTVEQMLVRMGLAHVRGMIIGDETIRGVSGGQRKRVNIAIELLTEPNLLFLDEPTSGLDATSALDVLRLLRDLANNGKTIIMTIHQPRFEVYEMMDSLVLLASGGNLAYYGPTSKRSIRYFEKNSGRTKREQVNPADFALDALESRLVHKTPNDWKEAYLKSSLYTQYVVQRLGEPIKEPDYVAPTSSYPLLSQFQNVFFRYLKRKQRDRTSLIIQLAQAPVIIGLLGLLFFAEGTSLIGLDIPPEWEKAGALIAAKQLESGIHPTLFLICAAAFWLGCSNVARELISDKAVYYRETRAGLRPVAYLGAIFSSQLLLVLLQTAMIAALAWSLVGLSANFFLGWFVLFITAASGICLGLLISAFATTEVAAISIVPVILLPQLMMGGYIKRFGFMFDSMYGWQVKLASLMPIRWSFEAIAILEYNAMRSQNEQLRELVAIIGFERTSSGFASMIVLLFGALALLATWMRLHWVKRA